MAGEPLDAGEPKAIARGDPAGIAVKSFLRD